MNNFEQPDIKYRIIDLTDSESKYAGSYSMPFDKTLDDLEKIEFGTSDGKLEFRLKFKDGTLGTWNTTSAENPKEQGIAMNELKKYFGEDKFE
jgi:hypothetical protein